MAHGKPHNNTLSAVLALAAALLVLSGVGFFWVAWKGIQILKQEAAHAAAHAATVAFGDASVLVGKSDYIGSWEGGTIKMTIDSSGHVDYARKDPGSSEELNGALSFDGADLVIDVLVMQKHLHIDTPPHLDGSRWLMELDGVELERR